MSWTVDHYRRICADAMKQYGGEDGKYTYSTSMYQAAIAALTHRGSCIDLVSKVLLQNSGLRLTDLDGFQSESAWDEAGQPLKPTFSVRLVIFFLPMELSTSKIENREPPHLPLRCPEPKFRISESWTANQKLEEEKGVRPMG